MGVCLPVVISTFHRHLGKADAVRVATQLAHSGSSANETHANQLVQLGFSLGRGANRTGPHGRGW
jgi:hypothetical protein